MESVLDSGAKSLSEVVSFVTLGFILSLTFISLMIYYFSVSFYIQPELFSTRNFFSLTATSHTLEEVYRSPPVFLTCAARLQKQVSCTIGSHSTEHGELQNRFSYFPFPLLLLFFFFRHAHKVILAR